MQFSTSFIAAAAAFLPLVSAHCKMVKPAPFGFNTDNAPLDPSGSNYPCKMPQGYSGTLEPAAGNDATYEPGVPNTFEIMGGATHGGGSCQVSITYDNPPTKDSVFKVIQSYEGGCPILAAGNVNGDASNKLPQFPVTVPVGMKSGPAIFAWTWFNKVGNREMYMNCAPIMIGGSSKSDDLFNSLPDMFVANIKVPQSQCDTKETFDITFPNPGKNVIREQKPGCNFMPACGGSAGGDTGNGGSYGNGGAGRAGSGGQDTGAGNGGSYAPGPGENAGAGSSQGSGSNDGSYPGGIFVGVTTTIDNGAPAATYTPINDSPSTTMQSVVARPTGSYGNGGNMGGGNMGGDSPAPIDGGDDSSNDGSSDMGGNYGSGNVSAPAPVEGQTCDGSQIISCTSDDATEFTLCYGKGQMARTFATAPGMTCGDVKAAHAGGYKARFKRSAREHARRMAHRHSHRRF